MQTAETIGLPRTPVKADPYSNKKSIEFGFRSKRFQEVQKLIQTILDEKGHCEILDLGGTETYWLIGEDFIRSNRDRLHFTVLNTDMEVIKQRDLFTFVQESATAPDLFGDRKFDLVHSNSVIEHVGFWSQMQAFAANTRRLAPRYYMQTPNYWFPYEPHFRFPGFQYLPASVRAKLIMRFSLGFFQRIGDRATADGIIHDHRLISTRQVASLFPDAHVSHEKFAGLNKSIIAIRAEPPRK